MIEAFLKVGMKPKFIVLQIGVPTSTICRELKRNVACRGRTTIWLRAQHFLAKRNNWIHICLTM